MFKNTFTYRKIEQDGKSYHLLTANEYPGINIQIIPFSPTKHDEAIAKLTTREFEGWVIEHPTRRDFAAIHVGGAKKFTETQENYKQVLNDMKQCMRNATIWWAERNPGII